jgi:peptide methionine sulfoxide reductase MsrA
MRDKGDYQPAQSRYPTGVMVITSLQKYNIQVFSNKMEHFPAEKEHQEYLSKNATYPARKFSSCKY